MAEMWWCGREEGKGDEKVVGMRAEKIQPGLDDDIFFFSSVKSSWYI